jgi:hypothetical protein
MDSKIEVATKAALLLHGDAVDVKFVKTHKTGEDEFTAGRKGKIGQLIITLNPNGTKAAVEWRGRLSRRSTDYRVFRVEGVPTNDDSPSPATGR